MWLCDLEVCNMNKPGIFAVCMIVIFNIICHKPCQKRIISIICLRFSVEGSFWVILFALAFEGRVARSTFCSLLLFPFLCLCVLFLKLYTSLSVEISHSVLLFSSLATEFIHLNCQEPRTGLPTFNASCHLLLLITFWIVSYMHSEAILLGTPAPPTSESCGNMMHIGRVKRFGYCLTM